MIELNDGNAVPVASFLHYLLNKEVTELPIAQRHVSVWDHPEPVSVDFFLRAFSDNMDTAQATVEVVEQFFGEYLEPCAVQSRVTGRMVKGIRIIPRARIEQ